MTDGWKQRRRYLPEPGHDSRCRANKTAVSVVTGGNSFRAIETFIRVHRRQLMAAVPGAPHRPAGFIKAAAVVRIASRLRKSRRRR